MSNPAIKRPTVSEEIRMQLEEIERISNEIAAQVNNITILPPSDIPDAGGPKVSNFVSATIEALHRIRGILSQAKEGLGNFI